MRARIVLFHFSILFFTGSVIGQQREIDSLLILLKKDVPDTTKLIHLTGLAYLNYTNENYNEGLNYNNKILTLSDTLLRRETSEIVKHTINKLRAKAHYNIGDIYGELANYGEALKHYFSALSMFELLKEQKDIANAQNNMGNIYFKQTKYEEAFKHYQISLKIKQELGDKKGIANSLNSMGNVYITREKPGEALKYYTEALEMKKQIGNKKSISVAYANIGVAQRELKNYEEALRNFLISQKIKEEIKDQVGFANNLMNMGGVLTLQKKYAEAAKQLLLAKNMAKDLNAKFILKGVYGELYELGDAKGDYKMAFENHKLYSMYSDSFNNESIREQELQSKMTYEFEKKEAVAEAEHKKEIEHQQLIAEEKNRKQKLVTWCVSIGLVMVLIFLVFIFRSLRTTRQQKIIIERKNQEVEEKQKEIIDSIHYARRIQNALMASEKYIDRTLNKLRNE